MENPYEGRATLSDTPNGVQITIPAKKSWAAVIFLGVWIFVWFFGVLASFVMLIGQPSDTIGFTVFWIVAWTAGGIFALRIFLWLITGREIISFERGQLTLEKKGTFFMKPKTFDLNEVKNIRISENDYTLSQGTQRNTYNPLGIGTVGRIKFDYGLKTIKMCDGIDEAEGKYLITALKHKGIVKPESDN